MRHGQGTHLHMTPLSSITTHGHNPTVQFASNEDDHTHFDIPHIQCTSDTVRYRVYRFQAELKDRPEPVFNPVPKSAYPIDYLCHSSRLCVDYVCSINLSSHKRAKYDEHIDRREHAAGCPLPSRLTTTFHTFKSSYNYCENYKRICVFNNDWDVIALRHYQLNRTRFIYARFNCSVC